MRQKQTEQPVRNILTAPDEVTELMVQAQQELQARFLQSLLARAGQKRIIDLRQGIVTRMGGDAQRLR